MHISSSDLTVLMIKSRTPEHKATDQLVVFYYDFLRRDNMIRADTIEHRAHLLYLKKIRIYQLQSFAIPKADY